jgi:hypothetical protein
MDAPEVAVNEGVPGLRLVLRAFSQPEVPRRVLVPRVRLQERVLVGGRGLEPSPIAAQDVVLRIDELRACATARRLIVYDAIISSMPARGTPYA